MRLGSSGSVPPIVLLAALFSIRTPVAFGTAADFARLSPIVLPLTVFPVANVPAMSTPAPTLPEIVLALPMAEPPMTLFTAPMSSTPVALPIAAVPAAFVPIRLPVTKFPMLVVVRALHHDPGSDIAGDRVRVDPVPVRLVEVDAVVAVPDRRRARGVRADLVRFDDVAERAEAEEVDAVGGVSGDRVAADLHEGRVVRVNAVAAVADR